MNSAYEGEQDHTQVISARMRMVMRSLNNKTLTLVAFVVSVFVIVAISSYKPEKGTLINLYSAPTEKNLKLLFPLN